MDEDSRSSNGEEGEQVIGSLKCEFCNKEFTSWKALYGHMRSHPERPWRGMKPPTSSSSSSAAAFRGGSPPVDCSTSLTPWPITAKRGGTGSPLPSSSSSNQEEQINKKREIIDEEENDHTNGTHDHQIDLKDLTSMNNKYQCVLCNKSFSSHQALGGHKSSHKKRNKTHPQKPEDDHVVAVLNDMTINTSHSIGTTMEQQPQTTPSPEPTQNGRRRMLDVDLNEPPPVDDNENQGTDSI